jgi:hypothetical protein
VPGAWRGSPGGTWAGHTARPSSSVQVGSPVGVIRCWLDPLVKLTLGVHEHRPVGGWVGWIGIPGCWVWYLPPISSCIPKPTDQLTGTAWDSQGSRGLTSWWARVGIPRPTSWRVGFGFRNRPVGEQDRGAFAGGRPRGPGRIRQLARYSPRSNALQTMRYRIPLIDQLVGRHGHVRTHKSCYSHCTGRRKVAHFV